MGAKVKIENYMPGHYSMRDITRESNGASWPPCYGDNNLDNGHVYYGFLSSPFGDLLPEYDKDVVKQTMLEHEAVFKNQVYELHRLYRVQRDLMDEVRRKEQFSRQLTYEASSSSSPVPSQMRPEDMQRWNRPSILGSDSVSKSSPYSTKGKNVQIGPSPFRDCHSPRNSEVSESRPTKCRRTMLDLQLPVNAYVDITDEVEQFPDKNRKLGFGFGKSKILADLNEPIDVEETTSQRNVQCRDLSKSFLSKHNRPNTRDWFSYALESEQRKGIHEQKPTVPPTFPTVDNTKGDPRKIKYGGKSFDQCASSWGKSIQVQANPWNLNNVPVSNEPFGGDPYFRNGFDYTNCNYDNDKKISMRDVNLNVALPNDDIGHKKSEDYRVESSKHCSNPLESGQSRDLPFGSSSCNNGCSKILGVPIFASPSGVHNHGSGKEEDESSRKRIVFDMNVPWEPEPPVEEDVVIVEKEVRTNIINHFDLNSCITEEEEEDETPCGTRIDLEARSAAETIIALSSSSSSTVDPNPSNEVDVLHWFVDIACSLTILDDFESMTLNLKELTFEEYFPKPSFPVISNTEETSGSRCLLGTRTRKGQTRRGRQRRDFQRDILPGLTSLSRNEVTEDLQIFGGLMRATGHPWHSGPNRRNANRNGSTARGRRGSVIAAADSPPQLTKEHSSNVDVGSEDRSLTGWGKTTRRPRRQRYSAAAGNPPLPVGLTLT